LSTRVDFYGVYRPIVGAKSIAVDDGLTVRQALALIVTRFPALGDELLDRAGQLCPWIPLYVNGRNPRLWADGLDQPIGTGDVLSIFSPIASGKINVEDSRKHQEET
jgi:molybdopterin converting factor small subunit